MKTYKLSKIYLDINEQDEIFAKDENGEVIENPIEEITNKLNEAAEEGIAVDISIKEHKERPKREKPKKYLYSCSCSEFNSKCGELKIKCKQCNSDFEVSEI